MVAGRRSDCSADNCLANCSLARRKNPIGHSHSCKGNRKLLNSSVFLCNISEQRQKRETHLTNRSLVIIESLGNEKISRVIAVVVKTSIVPVTKQQHVQNRKNTLTSDNHFRYLFAHKKTLNQIIDQNQTLNPVSSCPAVPATCIRQCPELPSHAQHRTALAPATTKLVLCSVLTGI